MQYLYFFCLYIVISEVSPARILGLYPMPSVSHQVVFRALTYELAKRGHELVVVTSHPGKPKARPPDNITEIDTSYLVKKYNEIMKEEKLLRGVVMTPESLMTSEKPKLIIPFVTEIFKNKEFKAIIGDKKQKFDLIIGESFFCIPAILARIYDAPMIWFSSFYAKPNNFEEFGAPARHPLLYPTYFRDRFLNLSLWEKIYQIYVEFNYWYTFHAMEDYEIEALKDIFGKDVPSVQELKNNIDLLFVNTNPIFGGSRPVPPNVVFLGGLHMKPVEELPVDLKTYLDNAKCGVIYVSLGTNVRPSIMEPSLLDVFLKAFLALPYDILWRFDGDELPEISQNVRAQKWFPQRDLLAHPNVKAFVTQGGLQSTDEAIDSGVPLVGIPALGDQWFNVEQYERLGIGVKLDMLTLQIDDLVNAVQTVVTDKRYRENALKLGKLMRDQPVTPLERAVWWTEYVIRYKGAKHLRSSARGISWSEYLMFDVVATVLVTVVIVILVSVRLLKQISKFSFTVRKHKKQN